LFLSCFVLLGIKTLFLRYYTITEELKDSNR